MQRFHLLRTASIVCALSASALAHAVTFDPQVLIGSPPVLLTSTSDLGSLTVNANSYSLSVGNAAYPDAPYPITLFSSSGNYSVAEFAGFDAVATPAGGINISSTSFYAGQSPAQSTSTFISPRDVRADLGVPLATTFNSPSEVGLQIELKGGMNLDMSRFISSDGQWLVQCGVGCVRPLTLVTPTYHLTLMGTTDAGQTLTLLDETRTSAQFDHVLTSPLGGHITKLFGTLALTNNPTGYQYYLNSMSLTPTALVPEPATMSLWLLAVPGLIMAARRRRGSWLDAKKGAAASV